MKDKLIIALVTMGVWLGPVGQVYAAFYSNDFEDTGDPLTEWSSTSTDLTAGTPSRPVDRFLGQFGNGTVSLNLGNLPSHGSITVSFDLYVIRTWDGIGAMGPDVWNLSIGGGETLLNTTFSNMEDVGIPRQSYPDWYPGGDHPSREGAAEINTLGFVYYGSEVKDSVYRLEYTFPHSSSAVRLDFSGSGLQGIEDESWGLDNVAVIPEPGTLSLLALGGLVVLRRRRK